VTGVRSLPAARHAVYRLAPGLLLVFKPRGHREPLHSHPYRQHLRVVRGRLEVATRRRRFRLTPRSSEVTLAAGRVHATQALVDTWLLVRRA